MADTLPPLILEIKVKADQVPTQIGKVSAEVEKAAGHTSNLNAKTVALGSAFGTLAAQGLTRVVGGLGDLYSSARAAEKTNALVAQAIKTTGGAANISAAGVDDLATSISNKTGIDDDQIKSSEALLLTFTNIKNSVGQGNDIFNQATATIQNMSVALGQDGKSSAIQLGKALNDPIKGITALSRVGVSFTEQQKAQIAAMVKAGDTAGAQKVILAELGKEFGGAAEAAATPTQKLQTTAENLAKGLATKLLPVVDSVSNFLLRNQKVIVPLIAVVGGLLGVVYAITVAMRIWTAVQAVLNLVMSANPIGLVVLAIAALVAGVVLAYQHSEVFRKVVSAAFHAVGVAVGAVVGFIVRTWNVLFAVISAPFKIEFALIKGLIDKVPGWISGLVNGIKRVIGTVANILTAPFRAGFDAIAGLWNNTVGRLSFSVPSWVPFIGGKGFSMPKLPILDQGGVVSRPTLALLAANSQPEVVAPLSKLRGSGLGGGLTVQLVVQGHLFGSAQAIVRELMPEIQTQVLRNQSRNGFNPLSGAVA